MKNITSRYCLYIMITTVMVVLVYACKKDSITNLPYSTYDVTSTQGQLKINFASSYTKNPSVLIKINGAVVSSAITTRTPFPGGGYNTNGSNYALYLAVPQGKDSITIVIPKSSLPGIDSIVLFKKSINIPDNGAYTLHITDTIVNATTDNTKFLLVKNIINTVDSGYCRFRFVNLIPNVPAVDLYLNGVVIKSGITYLQATDTFRIATGLNAPGVPAGSTSPPTPTWAIRIAGSAPTSTALASYASTNGLQNQVVLTGFFMGYSGAAAPRIPYLSFTLDKNQ